MDKKNLKISEQIQKEYFRIKELLGRIPSRRELFIYMEDDIYELAVTYTKENPFKRYLSYRRRLKELTADEETFYQNEKVREFIKLLENTSMSKVYKMPVLMAFYNEGKIRQEVSKEQLLTSWKAFFLQERIGKTLRKGLPMKSIMRFPIKTILKRF